MKTDDGRVRVAIESVRPELDEGRFAIKRVVGEDVVVEADIFADGHDVLSAVLKWRGPESSEWNESRMELIGNDRWQGRFAVERLGTYLYTIQAWVDHFQSWRKDLEKKFRAGQDVALELRAGVPFLEAALRGAKANGGEGVRDLEQGIEVLGAANEVPTSAKLAVALSPRIVDLLNQFGERTHSLEYGRQLRVTVEPELARFGAWYELFPRSTASEPGRHGTFKDCIAWLPRIAQMGFDVLYFPPIHPIGYSFRKGKNNSLACAPDDPGSPWAIGSAEGGHKAVHPNLGTLEDFRELVRQAKELGLEVALDIAFQTSPDHPWVKEHPQWFKRRPDGSVQYAENPPKKYQDIYPLNFETEDWQALWRELKSVFEFWIEQGVWIFRVDNPHTKPFRFWEWCLGELKRAHPELIFLSEAFTRPKVMYYLAKAGFTQSYNYFPWRNTKLELTEYLTELTQTELREFFRPSLWPNTPDILTQYLRHGGRAAFMARFVLAATLGASYGLYGPAFEVCESEPRDPDGEEYLNSEKYEIRHWKSDAPGELSGLIAQVNRIRREHQALRRSDTLRFHSVDNENLIGYSKSSTNGEDLIITVVNLDPHHVQRGWIELPLEDWGIGARNSYQLHELITGARYLWSGRRNYVELDPAFVPAHIFHLRRYVRTEQDFDYFM